MVLPLICVFIFPIVILFITRAVYLVIFENGRMLKKIIRKKSAKTLITLGSGGHSSEILRIVQKLDQEKYTPRIYVQAQTDYISTDKVQQLENNSKDYSVIKITRSREVHQSYLSSILTTVYAILQSLPIIWKEKPDLLLCNGPGTCIPLCLVAFFLNSLFITKTKIIFVESFCRVKSFSLSGQILYYIANHIIVQWPYLNGAIYNRSIVSKIQSQNIANIVDWKLLQEDLELTPNEIKLHLHQIFLKLQNLHKNDEFSKVKKLKTLECFKTDLLVIEACIDRIWEMLNSGYWKDVSINYKYSYSLCSVLKTMLLDISIQVENDRIKIINILKEMIQQIDKGILLGAPLPKNRNLLTEMASKLHKRVLSISRFDKETSRIKIDNENLCTNLFSDFISICCFMKPSMETFYCKIFKPKIPALLKGCIEHWKALHLWKNIEYLQEVAGNRMVPIELGSRYTEDDWTQSLIVFSDFLKTHISENNSKIGYLAQHQLFDQIPELKNDFSIPDYCNFSDKEDIEDSPDINAWFGPAETVSPLHYDQKNNLLCQVFGYKRVILYSPDDSSNLYPYETRLLHNTAKVDPYNPNFEKYPNFQKAKGFMCYLKPGDMLFIPPKWWHHVVGLTSSFSISFWWE